MSFNPINPAKYQGTDKYITFFVSRNRLPTGADYRQPETGRLYSVGTVWQVGKDPTTGVEGDLWMLAKIVANVAYWVQLSNGGTAFDSFQVQSVTAPGVNPVTADLTGLVTVNAAVVANHSVVMETRSRALNAFNVEVQYATGAAASDGTKSGVCHFDTSDFSVDASGFVSLLGSGAGQTITGQSGGALSPTAGNWNIFGLGEMTTSGSVSTISILQPRAAKFIVDPTLYYGTHQTLTAALAAASSGDTILIRPCTLTENCTLKAGVDICGLPGVAENPNVIINGKLTASFSGSCTLSSLQLKTNSDFALVISGSSDTTIHLDDVSIYAFNNTAISYTSSNADSSLNIYYSYADTATTGVAHFADSSAGTTKIFFSDFQNSGLSSTANTKSAGQITVRSSNMRLPLTYSSSSGASSFQHGSFNTAAQNAIGLTTSGTGTISLTNTQMACGSAACISIGAGTSVSLTNSGVNSSAAFVLTGAGTLNYGSVVFTGTSNGHNVSTENAYTVI